MVNIIKQDNDIFINYYDKINKLIVKRKKNEIKNINYEMLDLY